MVAAGNGPASIFIVQPQHLQKHIQSLNPVILHHIPLLSGARVDRSAQNAVNPNIVGQVVLIIQRLREEYGRLCHVWKDVLDEVAFPEFGGVVFVALGDGGADLLVG